MRFRSFIGHGIAVLMLFGVGACGSWAALTFLDNDLPTEFDGCEIRNKPAPDGQAIVECSVWRHKRCAVNAEQVIYDALGTRYVVDPYHLTRTGALGRRTVKYAF